MPQIFHPSSNTFSRVSIFGAVFFLAGVALLLASYTRSSYRTRVNVPIEQPVQFSHQHHVAGLGIECRYCHAAVEKSSFADIPPTHTCMSCHSQIWIDSPALEPVRESYRTGQPIVWVRVNNIADFSYFNHQIHVNKGFGCETCHGRVDQMQLTYKAHSLYMEWCLECHRHPEKYIRPHDQVFMMGYQPAESQETLGPRLVNEYQIPSTRLLEDCSTCHR
jgi:hypothetical protein